jgi:hypothetical protein
VGFDTGNRIYDLESELEDDAIKLAKRKGWLTRKFKHPGRRSAPDRWFAKGGCIFWIEFKRAPNEPTPGQREEIRVMRAAGLDVLWLDSIEDFGAVLADREARITTYRGSTWSN